METSSVGYKTMLAIEVPTTAIPSKVHQ